MQALTYILYEMGAPAHQHFNQNPFFSLLFSIAKNRFVVSFDSIFVDICICACDLFFLLLIRFASIPISSPLHQNKHTRISSKHATKTDLFLFSNKEKRKTDNAIVLRRFYLKWDSKTKEKLMCTWSSNLGRWRSIVMEDERGAQAYAYACSHRCRGDASISWRTFDWILLWLSNAGFISVFWRIIPWDTFMVHDTRALATHVREQPIYTQLHTY